MCGREDLEYVLPTSTLQVGIYVYLCVYIYDVCVYLEYVLPTSTLQVSVCVYI
jgi:hypothetical protein